MGSNRTHPWHSGAVGALVMTLLITGCGSATTEMGTDYAVHHVPAEFQTVQDAVDNAAPGDLVLIAPGVYREAIQVTTEAIVIRGEDRNTVIFDGGFALSDGFLVTANAVVIENLTVQNYLQNGIVFSGAFASQQRGSSGYDSVYGIGDDVVDGYRVSYITAVNNGQYGVYAFAARNGIIEDSYASGHPDSGFYVGQCRPCNALLRRLIAEKNAIGYYGTNASGDVWVTDSIFRNNRLGIAPNSQDAERLAPQQQTYVVANLVIDNDDPNTPEIPMGLFGVGIAIGGGTENVVFRNRIVGHDSAGILLTPLGLWAPKDNIVEENHLSNNAVDLVLRVGQLDGAGNCFRANVYQSSDPSNLQQLLTCGELAQVWQPGGYEPVMAPSGLSARQMPAAPPQTSMLDARTAPPVVMRGTPVFPTLDEFTVPALLGR